jgi:hypothetical protein
VQQWHLSSRRLSDIAGLVNRAGAGERWHLSLDELGDLARVGRAGSGPLVCP